MIKRFYILLIFLCALAIPAHGQTFTHVASASSGAASGSAVNSIATGSLNVTAGNLVVCMVGYANSGATYTGLFSVGDSSGNQWISGGNGSMGNDYYGVGVPYYSITTTSGATDVITASTPTGSSSGYTTNAGITCDEWSVTSGYHFVVDANTLVTSTGADSTTPTSPTFSTTVAAEIAFGTLFSYTTTVTAGNIGTNGATLRSFNGSNGSSNTVAIETFTESSTQSSITAKFTLGGSTHWQIAALSFSASNTINTNPIFATSTYVNQVSGSVSSITSPAIPLIAGQFAVVHCGDSTGTVTSLTVTSSPSNTWNALTFEHITSNPYQQVSYAMNVGAGSTTFTCTPNTAAVTLSMVVLVYSNIATTGALDVAAYGNASGAASVTTSAFSTGQSVELIFVCATAGGSGISFVPPYTGTIGGVGATIRQSSSIANPMYSNAGGYDNCGDIVTSTTRSSITATLTASGSSTGFEATAAAFKTLSTFSPTWVGPFSYGLN